MGRKRNTPKIKGNTFTVQATDPGLGFSPYQRDKGMGYTKSPDERKRDERRQTKRDLKQGKWE